MSNGPRQQARRLVSPTERTTLNLKALFRALDNEKVWPKGVPAENLRPSVEVAALNFALIGVTSDEEGPVLTASVNEDLAMLLDRWLEYKLDAGDAEDLPHPLEPKERVDDFALYIMMSTDNELERLLALWISFEGKGLSEFLQFAAIETEDDRA